MAFAKEGADVAISYLSEQEDEDARHTAELVAKTGHRCVTIRADLAEEANCHRVVDQAVHELGGLDVLVNNVATQQPVSDFTELSTSQLERTFRVNIFSYFWTSRAAIPHLPDGGAIINTSSINGLRGNKTLIDYAATKGAVLAFTYSLAQAMLDRGIRVNSVAPGPVWTPLIPATFDREKSATSAARRRWAGPRTRMRSPRPMCSSPAGGCPATTPARCWPRSAARRCPVRSQDGRWFASLGPAGPGGR